MGVVVTYFSVTTPCRLIIGRLAFKFSLPARVLPSPRKKPENPIPQPAHYILPHSVPSVASPLYDPSDDPHNLLTSCGLFQCKQHGRPPLRVRPPAACLSSVGADTAACSQGLTVGYMATALAVIAPMGGFIFGYNTSQISDILIMPDFLLRFWQMFHLWRR